MGRNIKCGIDYFSHDTHISGKTIFTLEQYFGNDGYAFWFKLLELLGEQKDLFYDCSNTANWLYLTSKMKISAEKSEEVIKILVDLEAIDSELWEQKKIIWCQNFVNRLTPLFLKRKEKIPDKPHFRSGNTLDEIFPQQKSEQNSISAAESTQRKEKNSKVKNSKVSKEVSKGRPQNLSFDEIINEFTQHEPLRIALIEFVKMRKLIKKPLTSHSLQLCLTERNSGLFDLSGGSHDIATQVVNQSIRNSWQGLFALKTDRPSAHAESKNEKQNRILEETLSEMHDKGVL